MNPVIAMLIGVVVMMVLVICTRMHAFPSLIISAILIAVLSGNYTPLGEFYPTVGYDTEIIYMWVATGLHTTQMHLDDDEFLTPDRIPLAKAYEMVMSGEIKDGKTIAGVLKLKALVDEGRL